MMLLIPPTIPPIFLSCWEMSILFRAATNRKRWPVAVTPALALTERTLLVFRGRYSLQKHLKDLDIPKQQIMLCLQLWRTNV